MTLKLSTARASHFIPCLMLTMQALRGSAETGYEAWLRYEPLPPQARVQYLSLPGIVFVAGDSPVLISAREELARGLGAMLGLRLRLVQVLPEDPAFVLGTISNLSTALTQDKPPGPMAEDAFSIKSVPGKRGNSLVLTGPNDRAVLYGTFALLRRIALQQPVVQLSQTESPYAPIRYLNHWDNLDGTIERGYAGKSIFWESNHVTGDLGRLRDYARLMAFVGVNGCSINNVNADARLITPEFLVQVARIADIFRPWGVRVLVSIDFASPRKIGLLDTFDPLNPHVVEFWKRKVDEIYRFVPDLGGFVLKADSEGRLGPAAYGRSHADAANVIARPLNTHGGLLFYRGFVYDHHLDWHDLKADRAKAAYDNFRPLDGRFDTNVVLQIKNGPIDFQVREPPSPLFGVLSNTCQAMELQITQEYTGQQRHLCFLVPMWKDVLDFDLQAHGPGTPIKVLVAGKTFGRPMGGFVAVSNVGRDTNWLGHPLAMANLYGYGRLSWDPNLSAEQLANEWTRLTFGNDPAVLSTVAGMELESWRVYESYTGPLGAGTLTDILGAHYGPAIESSERNGWGQWHRADEQGVGMDRTVSTGTGFIGQYSPAVAARFESLETCPDELLLFMHHVPYTHRLHSGKTVIQHIYDAHYAGAEQAARFVQLWSSLEGHLDSERYQQVLARLQYQAGHAMVWRDAVNNWFLKKSGIPDQRGRAGHFPNRFEAEAMDLEGYSVVAVTPWEAASAGKAARVSTPGGRGSLSFRYPGAAGRFDLSVQYFDQNNGISSFSLKVAGHEVDHWLANDSLPSSRPDGNTSTRRTVNGLSLNPGTEIRLEGAAQGGESACVDYLELVPAR